MVGLNAKLMSGPESVCAQSGSQPNRLSQPKETMA